MKMSISGKEIKGIGSFKIGPYANGKKVSDSHFKRILNQIDMDILYGTGDFYDEPTGFFKNLKPQK
jgi:hypothetical protein